MCSELQGSPGQQTKTLNIQRDSFNMEIKVNSADNVRLEVAIEECSDDGNNGSNENFGLREESKHRLKRLGKLYAGIFFRTAFGFFLQLFSIGMIYIFIVWR